MRNSPLQATVLALLAALSVGFVSQSAVAQKKEEPPKDDPYTVVKVDEEVRIIKKSELKALRTQVDNTYKQAVKDYTAAVKAARKSKSKVTDPKPKKAQIKVLKPSVKTKEEADKFVASLNKKPEEKPAKKKRPSKKKDG